MKTLASMIAVAFFLVSPGFACGPAEPQFQYGAAEMRAVIEGDWALTIMPTDGAPREYTLHLKQATKAPASAALETRGGLVRAAHACGSRTLVASASACIDITSMPLDVTLAPGAPAIAGTPSGEFSVFGTTFGRGRLSVTLGDDGVSAEIEPDGTVFMAYRSPNVNGTATLRKL